MKAFVMAGLMGLIFIAALLSLVLAPCAYALTPPFPAKAFLTIFFWIAVAEKTWAMFFRSRTANLFTPGRDWTTVAVGLAYVVLMYGTFAECYGKQVGVVSPDASAIGLGLWLAALLLRYGAFAELKHQWAIHLDQPLENRALVTTGPYRYLRHPLYLAYCLEAVSVPLVLNAFGFLTFAVAVFIPLEIYRAYFEEQYLYAIFGQVYREYAARVWAFFPLPFGKRAARRPPGAA